MFCSNLNSATNVCFRFDPDSALYTDLKLLRDKERKDCIELNVTFKAGGSWNMFVCSGDAYYVVLI